jgi:DNA polymerase-3 subunit gamma/tau
MKDEIAFTPAILKYRVYIIDEVHMMSASAFNALLKTLEEPPTYVLFILATTEYNKLPTTIVSRCQRFDFKRISSDTIVERLMLIASEEGIDLTEEGARVIARVSRGGMRDAISLLELCAGSRAKIDASLVFSTVGSGNRDSAYEMLSAVCHADYSKVYSIIDKIVMQSGDLSVFWQELIDAYRDVMVVKNTDNAKAYLDLTEVEYETLSGIAKDFTAARLSYHVSLLEDGMADMQRAYNSKRSIAEITLTRMCDARTSVSSESLALRIEELEKEISMLKLGVPVRAANRSDSQPVESVGNIPAVKPEEIEPSEKGAAPAVNGGGFEDYVGFGDVIEKIGELKRSLSVQFIGAKAQKSADGAFVVRMNSFFASRLAASEADMAILRGVIAEREGIPVSDIKVTVESMGNEVRSNATVELENALK